MGLARLLGEYGFVRESRALARRLLREAVRVYAGWNGHLLPWWRGS
ncbi:hypothetical protein [Streptomyces alboflavus]|nr:hypothetical protein [Streptomyces alboflavus]